MIGQNDNLLKYAVDNSYEFYCALHDILTHEKARPEDYKHVQTLERCDIGVPYEYIKSGLHATTSLFLRSITLEGCIPFSGQKPHIYYILNEWINLVEPRRFRLLD